MERLIQYLDDLDDFYGMLGLAIERLRRLLLASLSCLLIVLVAVTATQLGALHPPLALATSTLLFVTLLYRSITVPSRNWHAASS